MSPGFKTSLAALAVAGLMFAPVVGTGIAYAADTSTEETTAQVAASSSDDQAKADEAAKKAAAEAAQKKADEEAAAAKAEKEAADKAAAEKKAQEEADAKKAADEAAKKAEPTPTPEPEVSPTTDPTQSPTPEVAAKAKVAANTVSYDPVGTYFTHSGEEVCPAGPVHVAVKSGAPELEFSFPTSDGGTTTEQIQGGDEFDIDLVNGEITVTASVRFDDGNTTTFTVKCPAQDPDTDGDGVPDKDDAFPNDPNESADADKDGVGDNADKCPGTKADAEVNADGCSAEQLGDKPDATFPQDPKYNNVSFWNDYFGNGAVCVKFEPVSTPFTVPTNPSGYSWFSAIVKAGASNAANELYNGVKPGDKLVHSSGKNISHVILCKRAVATQYKYGTGLYIYKKLDPSKPAGWENSGTQRFVTSKEGSSDQGWFTSIPKLPDYVCGPGWGWQQDKQKVNKDATIVWPDTINYPVDNIGWPPIYDAKHGEMSDLGVEVPDCTTYYDAPTIQVWDQKCVVGDQGVGQYTDGGFVVTAADKVSVVVKDGDDKVVTDTSSVKPGVYTVFATAPKGGAWNKLPDGWSYVDESKTVIKTVVTVKAAKDCSVQKPPPDPSTYVWGQETWKCYDTQAVTKGERIDYVPTWIDGAWVQVAQPPVPVEKTRLLTEEEIVKACTPDPETEAYSTTWKDGTWKCGDTTVEQTRWTATWEIPYVIQWNEDGSYAFALDYDHAVLLSNVKDTRSRDLTKDEIAPCDNGDDSGPENGNGPSIPWWLVGSLAALGGAFFLRRRLA